MKTAVLTNVQDIDKCDLFIDTDGVLNSQNLEIHSLENADDYYFKIKALSKGHKIKNLIEGRELLRMDKAVFFYFTKEFHRLYSSMAIVTASRFIQFRVKLRFTRLRCKVPYQFFTSKESAKKWLATIANQG